MLTARGFWFLLVTGFLCVLGTLFLAPYTVTPALLSLTLLGWFATEWALFHARVNSAASRLTVTRRVVQAGREAPMVWAGQPFEVDVTVATGGLATLPFVALEDRLPQAAEHVDGDNEGAARVGPGGPARLAYRLRGPAPGVLRFEGVKVRVADLHGFFYHRLFLRDGAEFLILPPLSHDEGRRRADKRFNTLPPPGIHRLRRPGFGDELLDLRDYRAGDPPKMIAWKASARRDRLITKEYESDVPVRCVVFLDTSEGMRLGPPGGTPLVRAAGVAAAVAQAAVANRDLVGLTTFDEEKATAMAPARTERHTIEVLRRLAEVAALQPGTAGLPADRLTERAYPLAQELYPELMTKRFNAMPLGRLWLPLLDRRYGWLVIVLALAGPVTLALALRLWVTPVLVVFLKWARLVMEAAATLTPRDLPLLVKFPWFLALFFLFVFPPLVPGLLFWFFHGVRGWFGERRRQATQRKRLAAVFALHDGTGPAGVERLAHDDPAYAARVGRFLQERQVRMPVPLYDERGRYRYRCVRKGMVLANAVLGAVGRARDNESYVILADLAELGPPLAPVVRAVRVARARRHHVTVLVPWPADLPPPPDPTKDDPPPERRGRPWGSRPAGGARGPSARAVVRTALTRQYHDAFEAMRRAFVRVGATVVRVDEGDPVRLVLERLDRLRGVRSRR